jgi:hypothetical protein
MNRREVPIRTPCGADWDRMDPRGSARLCGQCDKLVHDLSSMTEASARALLKSTEGGLCVRYLYDVTGRVWFSDTNERHVPAHRLNRARRAAVVASALIAAPLLMQACGGASPDDDVYGRYDAGAADARTDATAPGGETVMPGSDAGAPNSDGAAPSSDADPPNEAGPGQYR